MATDDGEGIVRGDEAENRVIKEVLRLKVVIWSRLLVMQMNDMHLMNWQGLEDGADC